MARTKPIRILKRFRATPQRVFGAWLDPASAGCWLFATATRPMTEVVIDARVGGAFRFAARHEGKLIEYLGWYEQIVPHRRLVFRLLNAASPHSSATRVSVEIVSRDRGCELQLRHEHVPSEWVRDVEARWMGILYGLSETLVFRDYPCEGSN